MKPKRFTIRCSAIPRFWECPSSAQEWNHPVNIEGEPARRGSAVHEAMACHIVGARPDLEEIAHRWRVDDISSLYENGARLWEIHGQEYGRSPKVEKSVRWTGERITLTGHPDVYGRCRVGDWKSGEERDTDWLQLQGYALTRKAKSGHLFYVRMNRAIPCEFGYFDGFISELEDRAKEIGKRYAPGEQCTYCEGRLECQARKNAIADAALALTVPQGMTLRETIARAYDMRKGLKDALDAFDAQVKAEIASGGPIELEDGSALALVPRKLPASINPLKAWDAMASVLSTDEIAGVMTVGKTKLEKAIKAKKGNWAEFYRELQAAGAISQGQTETVKRERV